MQQNVSPPQAAKQPGFQRAEKKKAWIKIAMTGPSGSGKTFSALAIASGIGKKIALIDTENRSAALYADRFEFDTLCIDPPYTVEKYSAAIKLAWDAGYDVLIIDSISHAWAGEGGLLQQKEALDARGGKGETNKYANWGPMTKQHETFKAWMLKAQMHLIVTMRSKQDYVLGEGNKPVKVGLAPVQREGMEYEFTTVLDLAMNHSASASKDRTSLFDGKIFTPTQETGREFVQWLNGGSGDLVRAKAPEPAPPPDPAKDAARKKAFQTAQRLGITADEMKSICEKQYPGVAWMEHTKLQYNTLELMFEALAEEKKKANPPVGSDADIASAAAETASDFAPGDAIA